MKLEVAPQQPGCCVCSPVIEVRLETAGPRLQKFLKQIGSSSNQVVFRNSFHWVDMKKR